MTTPAGLTKIQTTNQTIYYEQLLTVSFSHCLLHIRTKTHNPRRASRGALQVLMGCNKSQKEHHRKVTFEDEYRALLEEHGIEWNEKYIF